MFKQKNIVIIDDDEQVLKSFKVWFNKYSPHTNITLDYCYDPENITQDTDAILIDFFIKGCGTAPDIISEIRNKYPDILIITMSGAFVIQNESVKCYNNDIMKQAMLCGSTRVCPKSVTDISDILRIHFDIRDSEN
jgi:DNA-binding NtrC family response regulator